MDFQLIFDKTLENLGLDPGEYKMEFTGDLSNLTAGSSKSWGLACGKVKVIWIKNNLSEMEAIRVILHEAKHLAQFKQGYQYPEDKDFMEKDANEYAAQNLMEAYLIARSGRVLKGMDLIRVGFDLFRNL